jgi:hypothetical protein
MEPLMLLVFPSSSEEELWVETFVSFAVLPPSPKGVFGDELLFSGVVFKI